MSAFCNVRTASPRFPRTGNADGLRSDEVLAVLTAAGAGAGAGEGAATGAMRASATAVGMSSTPFTGRPLFA